MLKKMSYRDEEMIWLLTMKKCEAEFISLDFMVDRVCLKSKQHCGKMWGGGRRIPGNSIVN